MGREEPAQLARRDRILEDLELLDVRVAMAAALEEEMAFTECAGAAEQGLGPESDRVPQRLVKRRSDGGHAASLRGLGAKGSRVDPADLGDLVEPAVRADDLGDPFVDARRDMDEVPGLE